MTPPAMLTPPQKHQAEQATFWPEAYQETEKVPLFRSMPRWAWNICRGRSPWDQAWKLESPWREDRILDLELQEHIARLKPLDLDTRQIMLDFERKHHGH